VDGEQHALVVRARFDNVALIGDENISAICIGQRSERTRDKRTIEEIRRIQLEEVVCELEDGPHVRRERAQLERQAVHHVVHVVKEEPSLNHLSSALKVAVVT
jgi:hypothetical protein